MTVPVAKLYQGVLPVSPAKAEPLLAAEVVNAIDRGGAGSNVRVIDPVNAMWRLMVLDADEGTTPEAVDRDAYLERALGQNLPELINQLTPEGRLPTKEENGKVVTVGFLKKRRRRDETNL
jgi:hypothetical protein